MTQQSLQGLQAEAAAASSSSSQDGTEYRIAFLLKLQQALEPLCQQEVAWVANQASRQQVDQQGKPGDNQQQQQQLSSQQQQQQHDSPQHAGCGIDILPAAATSNNTGHSSGHIPEQGAGGPAHVQIDTSSSIAQQSGPADWDYMLHQAALPYSQSLQREAGVLQQHLQLPGVVDGFSSLLQDLIGVRLVPRPPPPPAAAAAAADLWVPHIFVLDLFDTWGSQNEVESSDDDRQQGGMAADSSQHMYRSQQGGRVGQLLGTVYLDIGGGYGTRMLRYARKVPGSSSSTAAGCAANLMFPAVAVGISGGRLPPVPQQGQREGAAASTVAPAAAAAAAADSTCLPSAIIEQAAGVSASAAAHQARQAGGGQLHTAAAAAAAADNACLASAATKQAAALHAKEAAGGGKVEPWDASLSVSQLWELAHELGHAVHLVASSR
jgi:hypothetical protein